MNWLQSIALSAPKLQNRNEKVIILQLTASEDTKETEMAFRANSRLGNVAESPETLFLDIKSKKIPGLLTQQGDVLREYVNKFVNSSDVAAQLPTGSGKTLVALLIGEWRRLTRQERVLYLCPTNQLVHQVTEQARSKYGIEVVPFTGRVAGYSAADKHRYTSSGSIAVTSYSALFNSHPFFEDPHVIVLDDAHAAEQYVSSNWTMEVSGTSPEDQALFHSLCSLLRPHLDDLTQRRLNGNSESSSDANWVDTLPSEILFTISDQIESVIEANIGASQSRFAWSLLKGHISACNLYFTPSCVTIRPYLSPTFSHKPFHNATQRIYLSATPGEGGELERVFCRRKIERMTPPAGSQKHTIGRRFFLFPELALSEEEQEALILHLAKDERLLVLVGDNVSAEEWKNRFHLKSKAAVFGVGDIELSKHDFVHTSPAVAILANRYDGIDFPEDECRKSILVNIPTATNPQEAFLINRLGASRVYDARLITRIVQSFGRCTRSATDYSLVVIFGDRLVSYLSKKDRQIYFHPELQGELTFGLEESGSTTLNDMLDNVQYFLKQTKEWKDAEAQIYSHRDKAQQSRLPGSEDLAKVVEFEVRYVESLWNGDLINALESCKSVLGGVNSTALRGSRAIWNYFAGGVASRLSALGSSGMASQADVYYRSAAAAVPTLTWLHQLRPKTTPVAGESETHAERLQLDGIEKGLLALGVIHSRTYDKNEAIIREGIQGKDGFENAHRLVGDLLGYSAGKIESSGSPDPWWRLGECGVFVFEDHAGANSSSKLSVTKARQAATHENWIREKLHLSKDVPVSQILISPTAKVEAGALCHLHSVRYWELSKFRKWVEIALSTIREIRTRLTEPGDIEWRSWALGLLRQHNLTAASMFSTLPVGTDVLTEVSG